MAYYPSPRNDDEIFNPSNFPTSNPLSNLGEFALLYPNAQGAITFTETIGGTLNVLELGAGGIEYNGVSETWGNIQTKIAAIQAVSSATNSTTLNLNNALTIQNGETSLPPTTSMTLGAGSGNLTMLLNDGGTSSYGTAGQVLTSGGSAGSLTWTTPVAGGDNLNDVLTNGNSTTLSAAFSSTFLGTTTTNTINGLGLTIAVPLAQQAQLGKATLNFTNAINSNSLTLDNSTVIPSISLGSTTTAVAISGNEISATNGVKRIKCDTSIANPAITVENDTTNTTAGTLKHNSLLFSLTGGLASVGLGVNGTGLQLNTNGTFTLNGISGSNGQVLTYSGGNAVWATSSGGTTIQRGETAVASMNSTSGTVTYGSVFATKPYVVLSFNNNGNLTFIPIGVLSHQQNAGLQYTGFTWCSASTSATATITWYATI